MGKIKGVERVLVIGAGTMGAQIAWQCAMQGYEVALYDISIEMVEKAISRIQNEYTLEMVSSGALTQQEAEAALARITPTDEAKLAAKDIDLVSESIPEDAKLKGKVFSKFNKLCPPGAIFTSNSSSLLPSMYAKDTGRPDRFCAFHFHSPVWTSNVVDIMPHAGTSPETIALLHDFARSIGQIPIHVKKESPGYVFNAMLDAVLSAAVTLAVDDVANIQDIDRAWMGVMKTPIGPFGIMDLVGLDVVYDITVLKTKGVSFMPQARRVLNFFKAYVDQGKLGLKSSEGFYIYPSPEFENPGFVEGDYD